MKKLLLVLALLAMVTKCEIIKGCYRDFDTVTDMYTYHDIKDKCINYAIDKNGARCCWVELTDKNGDKAKFCEEFTDEDYKNLNALIDEAKKEEEYKELNIYCDLPKSEEPKESNSSSYIKVALLGLFLFLF